MVALDSAAESFSLESAQLQPAPLIVILDLKVRFSHYSIPDISLPVRIPGGRIGYTKQVSVNNLKGRIRDFLPKDFREHGLKLIHAGRVLDGRQTVGEALRLDPTILSGASRKHGSAGDGAIPNGSGEAGEADSVPPISNGKGKARAWDSETETRGDDAGVERLEVDDAEENASEIHTATSPQIYLHCAITPTPLSDAALASQRSLEAETFQHELGLDRRTKSRLQGARLGSSPNDEQRQKQSLDEVGSHLVEGSSSATASTVEAAPRGFDRLLASASGFDIRDVRNLRSQFRQVISARYTPDTMPSPTSLLKMEEAWLDDSSYSAPEFSPSAGPSGSNGGQVASSEREPDYGANRWTSSTSLLGNNSGNGNSANTPIGGYTDDDATAALDDTFFGIFIGFFWPLGACVWGLREEGVWSRRRGRAVMAGVLVNVLFGLARMLN